MCGLYSFRKSPQEVRALFRFAEEPEFPPRLHVAPGGPIGIVRKERGERHFALVRWGLIPYWTKVVKPGKPLINARGETVLEKGTFRNAMKRRRCLVPADGFYEWRGSPGRKQAFFVRRPDDGLFAFAGLWDYWMGADGSELESAAIITTDANCDIAPIHDRMPVVIAPEDFEAWLDCKGASEREASALIRPAPPGYFTAEPVVLSRSRPEKPSVHGETLQAPEQLKLL
jgi:putative SOS response-associated peptidase YedK